MSESKEMVKKAEPSPMDELEDLLPGIEEFLCSVLARESLSPYAEEQRQYFLERLDIIKMPPSVPPRPRSLGVNLFPVNPSLTPSNCNSIPSLEQEDFAAYQREISRALVDGEGSPEPAEVKVYDDIDIGNMSLENATKSPPEEEDSMYEIPQLKRSLSESGYEKAIDISMVSRSASTENILSTEEPPPLPPRKERTMSDATMRSSMGSILDERTQDIISKGTPSLRDPADNRSVRSSDDLLDDNIDEVDGVSCDSIDDTVSLGPEAEMLQMLDVQLPRPTKLKKRKSTRRKLGLSLSSLRESTISFRALEDILLSGELHYRSKLSWTKKLVALANGRLVCYKADKPDSRPSQIVVLQGYHATFQKREGKRGFEINLTHDMFESYTFLSDFKEWAEIWCEHINAAAEGKKAPGPVLHLARGSAIGASESDYNLGKVSHDSSSSNLSLASSDGFDYDPGTVKVKKRDVVGTRTTRMGSFAFKATQFFESLGKKSSLRKSSSSDVYRQHTLSASTASLSETSSPLTPESGIIEEKPLEITKHIKHQGYLDIYSNFNKRKWGKRWCMVHKNNFECYRTQTSQVCELEFLLQNCILRRAIAETKSELGLMLMENQKEKITIEPMNWTELGSWLRVLMQETSTPTVPDGLQGYMDDTNPYHEPVEITRLSDPFPASPPLLTAGAERTVFSTDSEDDRQSTPSRNRDSGNCSAESMFGSLERRSNDNKTHPNYTDSSLPRISANGSGDIYTQVKKTIKSGRTLENQPRSKKSTVACEPDFPADKYDYDFSATVPSMTPGESLMDEIMSQFKTQISSRHDIDKDDNIFNFDNIQANHDADNRRSRNSSVPTEKLSDIESVVSPIKNHYYEAPVSDACENLLCSSFLDESINSDQGEQTPEVANLENKSAPKPTGAGVFSESCDNQNNRMNGANNVDEDITIRAHKKENVEHMGRKKSSLVYDAESLRTTLEELRTKLVQLKRDRISIRDRKQKITSEINRKYLEAEFNRLNRECGKVQEEINYLEKLQESNSELHDIEEAVTLVKPELNVSNSNDCEASLPEKADHKPNDENSKADSVIHRDEKNKADSPIKIAETIEADSSSGNGEIQPEGSEELENGIKQTIETELQSGNVQDRDKELLTDNVENTQKLDVENDLTDETVSGVEEGPVNLNAKKDETDIVKVNKQKHLCEMVAAVEEERKTEVSHGEEESEKTEEMKSFLECAIPHSGKTESKTNSESVVESEDECLNIKSSDKCLQQLSVDVVEQVDDTDINGTIKELSSAFESKLKIDSSESE